MKVRTGFVSNSSSSSFILKLEEELTEDIAKKFFKPYTYKEYGKKNQTKLTPEHMASWLVKHVDNIKFDNLDFYKLEMILGIDTIDKEWEKNENELKEKALKELDIDSKYYSEKEVEYNKLYKEYEKLYDTQLDIAFNSNSINEEEEKKIENKVDELSEKIDKIATETLIPVEEKMVDLFVVFLKEKYKKEIEEFSKYKLYEFEIEGAGNGWDGLESTSLYENQDAFTEEFYKHVIGREY